jgi:hypothetical protein
MKSRFKNLVVSGCSFTHEPHNQWYPFAWPSILAETTGMQVHNLAVPGAGNDHIGKSLILFLERNEFNPADTLVMAMWSGIGRIDWITDASLSNFKDQYPFTYKYDEFNELTLGGNWWNNPNPSMLLKTLVNYSKFQSDHSLALHSWVSMRNLSDYLDINGFTYYYTSFVNYNNMNIRGDALTVNFFRELETLNLKFNSEHWLPLADADYYGDWSRDRNFLDADGFHPRYPKAPEGWVNQVLIPCLTAENILYE